MKAVALIAVALLVLSVHGLDDPFEGEKYEAGMIELEKGDEMFYWLFKSRNDPDKDPLVLWLTGGPGCSSELAVFYENGPFIINDDLSLKRNNQSWNEISNLLFIDQPLGTGFSKTDKPDHYARNEEMVADYFYRFFVLFLEKFPEYKGRPFYITGESYAGHYIPAITAYLVEKGNKDINLISSAIGNGWVDPPAQYPEYATFALEEALVGTVHHYFLTAGYWLCKQLIKVDFLWFLALEECQLMTTTILGNPLSPAFNVYDVRRKCDHPPLCYDFNNLDILIARKDVREALNVGDRSWSSCNQVVHTFMLGDWVSNLSPKVDSALKSGVGILVYSGDRDFICNWRGGEAWTNNIRWENQTLFQAADYQPWVVNGTVAGQYKKTNNFTFLRVHEAGHMVPMDQPLNSLDMLRKFIDREF